MSILSFLSNPIVFAAATVAAIGVIVYQIVNKQNEERAYTNGRNTRGRKSSTDSSSSSTNCRTFESNVRRRNLDENDPKPSSSNVMKQNSKITSNDAGEKKSNFDEERYKQNVFDKIEKDVKNFNQKDENKKQFDKNIDVSDCNETDNSENLDENKVINSKISNANHNVIHAQHDSSANDANRGNSRENNFKDSDLSISASDVAGTSCQNMTSSKCIACEEVPASAVACPCNHCYLCADCATMIFRIYRKCTICDSHVESFQFLAN